MPASRRLLFDRRAGLGLSIYRYNIGGGGVGVQPGARAPRSFLKAPGSYDWDADPGGTAFLRQAHRYGVRRLIGFANSAPRFFTTNDADCGGSLRPARARAYAAYLARVAAHLRAAYAVRLTAVSPMNEPTNSFGDCDQEGMHVGAAERATVIRDARRGARGAGAGDHGERRRVDDEQPLCAPASTAGSTPTSTPSRSTATTIRRRRRCARSAAWSPRAPAPAWR